MTIKIGVAGAHSTGKTSFCNSVAESLSNQGLIVARVPSFGSEAARCGVKLLRDHTEQSTLWFIERTIEAEQKLAGSSDVVLVDRPVPDALGYWLAALEYRGESADVGSVTELVRLHSKSYGVLFGTELDASVPLAAGRDPDVTFRKLVARKISEVLDTLDVPVYPLRSGELTDAMSRIHTILRL